MKRLNLKVLALQILLILGLLTFGRGFLPPSRVKPGFNARSSNVQAKFDRVIFMVVDAMRSDFLFSENSHMKGCHELLRSGKGHAFTAYSDPPTVTLPRLKGLTTGSSSNFLDAVINVAESDSASILHNQDSWVHQLHSQGKKLHMFGDDTWLKLFPDVFEKSEGTASFYVADFTEVDNNVTRHLDTELPAPSTSPDWDVLILHYLGLDHIGHKGGPKSPHMPAKQIEMDKIVTRLFNSMDNSTLLILAGDHGMNDVGNHGGSSDGETSAALALFAQNFNNRIQAPLPVESHYNFYSKIYQVDLVPTLAILMGFPIPKNSLGIFLTELLPLWSQNEQEQILISNCVQLGLSWDRCDWDTLKDQQKYLMKTTSEHILSYMVAGIAILMITTILCIILSYKCITRSSSSSPDGWGLMIWWLIIPALYFIGMMGSSTVEEEHYIWYWSLTGLLASLAVFIPDKESKVNVVLLIIGFRIMRSWNTAGQKWNSMTDVVDILIAFPKIKRILVILMFLIVAYLAKPNLFKRPFLLASIILFSTFKMYSELVPVSQWWMILLARIGGVCSILDAMICQDIGTSSMLIYMMQTKLENIPLWLIFYICRKALISLKSRAVKLNSEEVCDLLSLVGMCFEYASFFSIGGSNSLASVDLSNAYNGVSDYNVPLVAFLTYLSNWGPSLYFSSLIFSKNQKVLRTYFYGIATLSVTLACYILYDHLFIWTVFSPKLLYVGAWLFFHEIMATGLVTGISTFALK